MSSKTPKWELNGFLADQAFGIFTVFAASPFSGSGSGSGSGPSFALPSGDDCEGQPTVMLHASPAAQCTLLKMLENSGLAFECDVYAYSARTMRKFRYPPVARVPLMSSGSLDELLNAIGLRLFADIKDVLRLLPRAVISSSMSEMCSVLNKCTHFCDPNLPPEIAPGLHRPGTGTGTGAGFGSSLGSSSWSVEDVTLSPMPPLSSSSRKQPPSFEVKIEDKRSTSTPMAETKEKEVKTEEKKEIKEGVLDSDAKELQEKMDAEFARKLELEINDAALARSLSLSLDQQPGSASNSASTATAVSTSTSVSARTETKTLPSAPPPPLYHHREGLESPRDYRRELLLGRSRRSHSQSSRRGSQ
jgi:hypothetical protein